MVEHRLAKARVASSNLVSRSIPPSGVGRVGYGGMGRHRLKAALPRRGTQVVRERSAKPLCAGSIPARASKPSETGHEAALQAKMPAGNTAIPGPWSDALKYLWPDEPHFDLPIEETMLETTAQIIERVGLIPVLRARNAAQALAVVKAMIAGGVTVVEVTMTVPGAMDVLKELKREYGATAPARLRHRHHCRRGPGHHRGRRRVRRQSQLPS